MEQLRQRFCDQIEFVKVYVSEAHPTDEWAVYARTDIDYCQPKTLSERLRAARRLLAEEEIHARFVLAPMDNALEQTYAAHPERLCEYSHVSVGLCTICPCTIASPR
jgi:hypothetical protein